MSAKNQDRDNILNLNLDADDYMIKPFSPLEIIVRVKANLRCFYNLNNGASMVHKNTEIIIGALILNTENLTLTKNGVEIVITPNEYKIIALLMKSSGRVYTKSQICEAMNGELYDNYENVITVHISQS